MALPGRRTLTSKDVSVECPYCNSRNTAAFNENLFLILGVVFCLIVTLLPLGLYFLAIGLFRRLFMKNIKVTCYDCGMNFIADKKKLQQYKYIKKPD